MSYRLKPEIDSSTRVDTTTYLAHAVAVVHNDDYVRAACTDDEPTWRAALDRLERGAELSPRELRRAHEIRGWAASLKPRDPRGYRAHLVACLAHDRLTAHDLPLAASAVHAFNRHLYFEIRGRKSRQRDGAITADGTHET